MCGLLSAAAAVSLLRGALGRSPLPAPAQPAVPAVQPASGSESETVAVVMPWLGESVRTATVTSVHKSTGEAVRAGEAVCEVSTDKIDTEVPSDISGTVVAVLVQPPVDIAVGAPIMLIKPI